MKKRNLKSLKLNKKVITKLSSSYIQGGTNTDSVIVCEEPDTLGVCPTYNATFWSYCPC